jgi:hypothetical protein
VKATLLNLTPSDESEDEYDDQEKTRQTNFHEEKSKKELPSGRRVRI